MTSGPPMKFDVREATFDVMRRFAMTTIFSNPGSTEVAFLTDLPADLRFVLALHESSVVGIATGHALAQGEPAFVLLHTTAGLGNAVGAIATARVNHAPLVIVVGQQDRRHLALEPFLAGHLEGLAGEYPLDVLTPAVAQDVPSAIGRAAHTAKDGRGPVVVIVPMDDWQAPADPDKTAFADALVRPPSVPYGLDTLAELLTACERPIIVAGAGNDSEEGWRALVGLAERIGAPVWQEPFGARVGFPQDHAAYRGQLPADRSRVRSLLAGHDLLLVVGAAALRQYPYVDGALIPDHTRVVVVTTDLAEARRSPATLAVVAEPADVIVAVTPLVPARHVEPPGAAPVLDEHDESSFTAENVFRILDEVLGPEAVIVEETPSTRPVLERVVPTRRPFGFVSAAMGGLGFALPAAVGIKMALPDRPVVAVLGDGSSMYAIHGLWTAAQEGVGVLFVVMANGRYAVMDRLAAAHRGEPPWPPFGNVSVSGLATAFGCPATSVGDAPSLRAALSAFDPARGPLLIEVAVPVETSWAP